MRSFDLTVNEKFFNLLWRSLCTREAEMLAQIARSGEDSDEAALVANDVVYLRLCKKDMEGQALAANFSPSVFSVSEEFVDLKKL